MLTPRLAWHTMFAGDLHTRTAVARLPLHQLGYLVNWSNGVTHRQTDRHGQTCGCKKTKNTARNYWPMYSAVMWRQFSLAGGHDEQ